MTRKGIIIGVFAACSIMGKAFAAGPLINCVWDNPNYFPLTSPGYIDTINSAIQQHTEQYNCNPTTGQCSTRYYYTLPNREFVVTAANTVTCINNGDEAAPIRYLFYRKLVPTASNFKELRMILDFMGGWVMLDGRPEQLVGEDEDILEPCVENCTDIRTGWPQYHKMFTLTFKAIPIRTSSYNRNDLVWNTQDYIGNWSVYTQNPSVGSRAIPICIFKQNDTNCGRYVGGTGGGGGGNIGGGGGGGGGGLIPTPPPVPQCTLTITTPNVVQFQPISTDDLSRNRVRTEDFTLTASKGPVQSGTCIGNVYNLPGEIKTEGGYPISSTFWGINGSGGSPQGIGLKILDLDLGSYLQFNYRYPAFIKNIRTTSETKRFRAEIAASTSDLKKIKSGAYSQVLTFEVRIP